MESETRRLPGGGGEGALRSPLAELRMTREPFGLTMRHIGAPGIHPGENRILYAIISTVGSSLDLEEVLGAVVRLLTDACSVHACFVYLVEDDRLVLEAASDPYAHLVGTIALERGEGLAWWAAEHKEPAWIRDELLDDPRVEVRARARGGALPVARLRPDRRQGRERDRRHLQPHRGAARVHRGRGRRTGLERLARRRCDRERPPVRGDAAPGRRARAPDRAGRDPRPCRDARNGASGRRLARAEARSRRGLPPVPARPGSEILHLRASAPEGAEARTEIGLSELGPELARSGRSASVAVPLVANEELLGLLAATGTSEVDLARAVANQTAVALKKIELIERLTEKNLIKDFFEQLARGESLPGARGPRRPPGLRPRPALPRRGRDAALGRPRARPRSGGARVALRPARRLDPGAPARPGRGRGEAPRVGARAAGGARRAGVDRPLQRLPGRGQLRRRLRGGAPRAPRLAPSSRGCPA